MFRYVIAFLLLALFLGMPIETAQAATVSNSDTIIVTPSAPVPHEDRNVLIYTFRDDNNNLLRDTGEQGVGVIGTVNYPGGNVHFDAAHGVALIYVPPGHKIELDGDALQADWYECPPAVSVFPIPLTGVTTIDYPCDPLTLAEYMHAWIMDLAKP